MSNPLGHTDCSPSRSSIHGIFQARILEWVAIFYSRESSQPRNWTLISCVGRWILYPGGNRMYESYIFIHSSLDRHKLFPYLGYRESYGNTHGSADTLFCHFALQHSLLKCIRHTRNFLVVQWLRLLTFTTKSLGSIPGWGTKIPHAVPHNQIHTEECTYLLPLFSYSVWVSGLPWWFRQ